MIKYRKEEVLRFFEEYNMNCTAIAKLAETSYSNVKKYLIDNAEIPQKDMAAIDMAIRVIRQVGVKRPEWTHAGTEERYDYQKDIMKWRKEIKNNLQEERDRLSPFIDELMLIIGYEPDEFELVYDPIDKIGGLTSYGLDAALRRRVRKIEEMLM